MLGHHPRLPQLSVALSAFPCWAAPGLPRTKVPAHHLRQTKRPPRARVTRPASHRVEQGTKKEAALPPVVSSALLRGRSDCLPQFDSVGIRKKEGIQASTKTVHSLLSSCHLIEDCLLDNPRPHPILAASLASTSFWVSLFAKLALNGLRRPLPIPDIS